MFEIAVVTQPLGNVGQVRPFLDLLESHAGVTVVTAIETSELDDYVCRYYARENTRDGLLAAGAQFVANQFRMAKMVREMPADVVWFYGSTLYTLPILAARGAGKTVVCQPKGDVPLALYLNSDAPEPVRLGLKATLAALNRVGYAAANRIVTYSPGMADEYGLNGSKTLTSGARFVPGGFDVTVPMGDRPERVGFLGRLDPDKNVETVVEVAKRVSVPFHVAGDGSKADVVERELADVPGAEYHGWTDEPAEFLNQLKLLVLPSTPIEGLPTVILEALACGTPAISTPVSGVPDAVEPGVTGALLDSTEPRDIVTDIEAALAWDLESMSRQCRRVYEERFTRGAAVDRYGSLIREVAV